MLIENLNKENFWDDLEKRYPKAFEHFSKWMDEYKKETEWDTFFPKHEKDEQVKFHDLPLEMQNGIIARYELELFHNAEGKGREAYLIIASEYKGHVNSIFEDIEKNFLKTTPDA